MKPHLSPGRSCHEILRFSKYSAFVLILSLLKLATRLEILAQASLQLEIGAGKIDCFYHPARQNDEFEVEYQVLDGGDLDISVSIHDPAGQQLFVDIKQTDNLHRVKAERDGDYKICFDNGFSRLTPKVVFFEIYSDDSSNAHTDEFHGLGASADVIAQQYDMTVAEIQQSLARVHVNLEKAIKSQNILRAFEARDRHLLEQNYDRVNWFSFGQMSVMLLAGGIQVFTIRSLFNEKSKLGKLLRGKSSNYRSMT